MSATLSAPIAVDDAVLALAFIGDLSMGRPTDHSHRTAWLAARLAAADGGSAEDCRAAHDVSLLRWSGCTANAATDARVMVTGHRCPVSTWAAM